MECECEWEWELDIAEWAVGGWEYSCAVGVGVDGGVEDGEDGSGRSGSGKGWKAEDVMWK